LLNDQGPRRLLIATTARHFALSDPHFKQFNEPTVDNLDDINPAVTVPGHCTGWKAAHEIATRLPEAYEANSIGSTFIFN